jgi:hypothetical protein
MLALVAQPLSVIHARFCPMALPVAMIVLAGLAQSSPGAEAASPQFFQEQLAAGEFAPALKAARQIEHAPQRDAWLVKLAEAQAAGGARQAAFHTLATVNDDQTRNAALKAARPTAPRGARGGLPADFNSLIELITETVNKDSWEESGTGKGKIEPFRSGVYVDPAGVLQRVVQTKKSPALAAARVAALKAGDNTDTRRISPMRKVSLTRLEKYVQLALASGRPPSEAMLNLAGLEKIKYVLVYPDTGDLVLAGPASAWRTDQEGRRVSRASGRPVLQLDDLVVVMRYLSAAPQATFGCSINPTQEGLARTKQFAEKSSGTPLKSGTRPAWLKKLRDQMGRQSISIEGIDPRTRVAQVLVEADYRMKLVGMGLEPGTVDVPSYLDLIEVPKGQAAPPLDVLRWWFTLKYDAVQATAERDSFEIRGPGVQVLSENELLTNLGQQVHTGKSEPVNQEFAQRFTEHFAALGEKYPVYADLQNIFDLALVSALISSEHLADRVGWHMTCFRDADQYQVALGQAPQSVESVINHRVINQTQIIVGVSGGVHVEPWALVKGEAITTSNYGALAAQRKNSATQDLPPEAWWWD